MYDATPSMLRGFKVDDFGIVLDHSQVLLQICRLGCIDEITSILELFIQYFECQFVMLHDALLLMLYENNQ